MDEGARARGWHGKREGIDAKETVLRSSGEGGGGGGSFPTEGKFRL